MKALVAHELNRISVEEVTIDPPKAGELLIQMKATGVCHSDLSIVNGTIMMPFFPMVLGHEGAGVIQEVGPGVTGFQPGDHVSACLPSPPPCRRAGLMRACHAATHFSASPALSLRDASVYDGAETSANTLVREHQR